MRLVVAPVQLGCCPEAECCLLCPPSPKPPTVEALVALRTHYATERAKRGDVVRVAFFGGPAPSDELLAAAGPDSFVRVRPDLLTRAEAARLKAAGVAHVELDALTFDDAVLKAVHRRYRRAFLLQQLEGLRAMGFTVGIVLAVGLPGTSYDTALTDARTAVGRVDTARLHPVLVLDGARLRDYHMDGLYEPLELGPAVTACRAMADELEGAGVDVIRIGVQAGPDGLGRAVAGPRHSAFRQLVEARRTLDRLRSALDESHAGAHIVIRCAPGDETRTRGPLNQHIRTLRAEFGLAELVIAADSELERGTFAVDVIPTRKRKKTG